MLEGGNGRELSSHTLILDGSLPPAGGGGRGHLLTHHRLRWICAWAVVCGCMLAIELHDKGVGRCFEKEVQKGMLALTSTCYENWG